MAGIGRSRPRMIPDPGGQTAQEAVSIYQDRYGEMPVPATAYATASTALKSLEVVPSYVTSSANASVVNRANMRQGMVSTGGRQGYFTPTPQVYDSPDSSKFQPYLMGPQVNYVLNNKWYIAYPAATVMNGGKHNLAWSERVPQLPTRYSGGPGPATMRQAPRFKAVQVVPRYSTMPPTYPTASVNT